jgi:hypothetical protein
MQGIRTGLYFVRGCNIKINGTVPTFCLPYTHIPTREETDWAIADALDNMRKNNLDIACMYTTYLYYHYICGAFDIKA